MVLAIAGMFGGSCMDGPAVDSQITVSSALCQTTFGPAGASHLWPEGIIWYDWAPGISAANKALVNQSMAEWASSSDGAITFLQGPGSGRSVLFTDGEGLSTGHSRHEVGHKIAFDHEMQRSDRDRYLVLMSPSLFQCNPPGSANDVFTKVAPNSPYPAVATGPGATIGRYDFDSIMQYTTTDGNTTPDPDNCLLFGEGGDNERTFARRDISRAGTSPCASDVTGANQVITAHDGAALIELYSTTKLWSPGQSMGTDVGNEAPLVFKLASNPDVYAEGNPALTARDASVRAAVTRGTDGNIYVTTQVPGAAWNSLGKPPGVVGDPAVVSWSPARIDVAVVADSGGVKRVYKRSFDLGNWEASWVILPGTQPNDLTGGIAMASWGVNRLDIFANAGSRIRHQSWTGTEWTAWDSPGGTVPGGTTGKPAAVSGDANRIDVVVKAADNQIWQLTFDNGWSSSWVAIVSAGNTSSAPTIASWGPGRLDMFIRSTSGRLLQLTCSAGPCKGNGSWPLSWTPLGGFLSSGPAAASPRGQRRIDVVSLSDDGKALPTPTNDLGMWHRYWPWPYADRHVFDAPDFAGNPEAGAWVDAGTFIKADCSSTFKTMMVGLSAAKGTSPATGTRRAHSMLCGSDAQVRWDTQNVIEFRDGSFRSDGMGHRVPFGGAPNWDPGAFHKGECAIDEVVTGVAQETGGRLGAIRCSKMPSGKALGGACTTRVFSQEDNRGSMNAGDWAPPTASSNFVRNQCADGEGVAGVSAYISASGEIMAGAAHAIRCCRIVKRIRGDWDGDGRADYSLRRPSDGSVHIKTFAGIEIIKPQLVSVSAPETLDIDGDGLTDTVFRRTTDYTWFFNRTTGGITDAVQWGTTGDMVAIGDYDGDRRDDFAVVRPASPNFVWLIKPGDTSLPPLPAVPYGTTGDSPVPGDYDGDGRDDVAYWRPSTGFWHVIPTTTGVGVPWSQWGTSGDYPYPGDYDGDGKTDPAVFRPASGSGPGTWFVMRSSDGGTEPALVWGPSSGVTRLPRDYDGDGRTDKAYFDPSNNTWHVMSTASGTEIITTFGQSGDTPF